MDLLSPSCRIAFSALIHDIGKFSQRSQVNCSQEGLDFYKILSCPFNSEQSSDLLNQIIMVASQISSGIELKNVEQSQLGEEKNYYQARLVSLFEQISLIEQAKTQTQSELKYCYPLMPLSAESIFPKLKDHISPKNSEIAQKEYNKLWGDFLNGLSLIPTSHKQNWDLWLDHFDTAYQCFTVNIPSAIAFNVKPEVSLYDHSKTTAALATALWRYHEENHLTDESQIHKLRERELSWNEPKFLLIQGDFFGIQDFIFSGGSETNKQAAKLLRGRSFQVSLFTELAALKLLQACQLPSTSQILNAAGKFLIVAPNTDFIKQQVQSVQDELNGWFIEHTFGLVGLGIATQQASCNDFIGQNFKKLVDKLFRQLEEKKLQRLDLTDSTVSLQQVSYPFGTCKYNHYFPATDDENKQSLISEDQIKIGECLAKHKRIIICHEDADISITGQTKLLKLPIFGYNVVFTENEEQTGKFGQLVKTGQLYRFWDFSLPDNLQQSVWNGYARRYINAYIPLFSMKDNYTSEKYQNIEEDNCNFKIDEIKTFDYLACEDRKQTDKGNYIGQSALMTLKGDVDNLGSIFQKGLVAPTFAKMASLSRQMNQFFSLWLPVYCKEHNANVYTVFAGGDDFFLIGSWLSTQKLAYRMYQQFANYVAQNQEIHFSAGMVMTKVGLPIARLGGMAEQALESSKSFTGKNAATIYGYSVAWKDWLSLNELGDEIERLAETYNISTGYLYSLIRLAQQAQNESIIENTMWRSRFYYRTARYVTDKLAKEKRAKALEEISQSLGDIGIAKYKINFAIPLFNYFYQQR